MRASEENNILKWKLKFLDWKQFEFNRRSSLSDGFTENHFSDVTLVSDDQIPFQAHKFVLGSSSPFFRDILLNNLHPHPLIYLRGVKHQDLMSLLQFIYLGETSLPTDNFERFVQAAKSFKIEKIPDNIRIRNTIKNNHEVDEDQNKMIDEVPVNTEQDSTMKQKYKCEQCEVSFRQKGNLLYHVKSKHAGFVYGCEQCDYKVARQDRLRQHRESVHEGVKYFCNLCDYQTTHQIYLKRHNESVHEGVKYSCDQCEIQFTHKNNIKRHQEAVHEGMKYRCDICNHQFSQRHSLKQHQDSVHEGVTYSCNSCDYKATRQRLLKYHQESVHAGIKFNCSQCRFQTGKKEELKKHEQTKHNISY